MAKLKYASVLLPLVISLVGFKFAESVNVLYINDVINTVAARSVHKAIAFVERTQEWDIHVGSLSINNDKDTAIQNICNTYESMIKAEKLPNIILDTTTAGISSETVKVFSRSLGIPTISGSFSRIGESLPWRNLTKKEQDYLIQVVPPGDLILDIIEKIVLKQNISDLVILFDDTFVLDNKYKTLLQNIASRHVIAPINFNKLQKQLEHIRSLHLLNFFVLGSPNSIKQVLDTANSIRYLSKRYGWYAITQSNDDLKCKCANATIIYVKPLFDNQYLDRWKFLHDSYQLTYQPRIAAAFYFDLALRAFTSIRDMVTNNKWPKNMNYIYCKDYKNNTSTPTREDIPLREYFRKVSVPPVYGHFHISDNKTSYMTFNMELTAVEFKNGSPHVNIVLGKWNATSEYDIVFDDSQNMQRYRAEVVYRVLTVVQPPFVYLDTNSSRGYFGYCIDLMDMIAKHLNIQYEIQTVKDRKFGNLKPNGEWDGIVNELIKRNADIALGTMSVTSERESVIDFTVPYYDLVGLLILMKYNKPKTSLFEFLTVLQHDVWLCILSAFFLTSILLWVYDRWSPYSYQNNREEYKDHEDKREFNIKECIWFCMTSLTPQGGGDVPKHLSGRIVVATWWLFGFIVIASYTANLAAFFTVSRLDKPIESLDDLMKQYKVQFGPHTGSDAEMYFWRMSAIEQQFYHIWKDMSLNDSLTNLERSQLAVWDYPISEKFTKMMKIMKSSTPDTFDEAINRVRFGKNGRFAYIGDATAIKYLTLTSCDVRSVGEEFFRRPYALAVPQGSPLKDQLDSAILHFQSNGDLRQLKQKWWKDNPYGIECEIYENDTGGIGIKNIGGLFITVILGIFLAGMIFIFEYWYWTHYKVAKTKVQEYNSSSGGDESGADKNGDQQSIALPLYQNQQTPYFVINNDVYVCDKLLCQ